MKFLLTLFVSIAFSIQITAQDTVRLIIVHPTPYILNTFSTLLEKKIIDIPNIHITGVYHEKETYDYSGSHTWIENDSTGNWDIIVLKDELNANNLYEKNPLTDDFNHLFTHSDAIIFTGGDDIQAFLYGEKTNFLTRNTNAQRHYFELSFYFHLLGGAHNPEFEPLIKLKPDYTIMGICLGMQTMNVANGGSMIQDIPTQVYNAKNVEDYLIAFEGNTHKNYYKFLLGDEELLSGCFHHIKLTETPFDGINTDSSYLIYSNHHQAIKDLGKDYKAIGYSADGKIIEIIQHRKYKKVFGVQFHPENLSLFCDLKTCKLKPNGPSFTCKKMFQSVNYSQLLWKHFSTIVSN